MSAPARARMGGEEFETICTAVENTGAFGQMLKVSAEARRAREREEALEKALRVIVDGIGDSDHGYHCRLYRRIAREALEEKLWARTRRRGRH